MHTLMEQLLHYVWRHRLFPLRPLTTQGGERVEVIDVGLPNPHDGPDFFNAKVKVGATYWAGNVRSTTAPLIGFITATIAIRIIIMSCFTLCVRRTLSR